MKLAITLLLLVISPPLAISHAHPLQGRVVRAAGRHAPATASPAFTFTLNGTSFVYADAERTFTGILLKPAGNGPFPAAIVSHGQGGSAVSYSLAKAQQFLAWGLVSIAPNYTHAAGGSTLPAETGHCPENLARGLACLAVLDTLPYVDRDRIAAWGHSKGAYLTIGLVAAAPARFTAAGISAGGIVPDSAGTQTAAPTVAEASAVVAPFVLFHGEGDTTVPASQSLLFKQKLDLALVPNARHLYATSQHNLHQVPSIDADMMLHFEAWLRAHGLLR